LQLLSHAWPLPVPKHRAQGFRYTLGRPHLTDEQMQEQARAAAEAPGFVMVAGAGLLDLLDRGGLKQPCSPTHQPSNRVGA